ncbi:MAG: hypothetical protein ACOH2I_07490 [Pseudomonas sp.]
MQMNTRPQLVYLAFGAKTYQCEAIFSIATALARSAGSQEADGFDIQVFTDAPELYAQLPVQVRAINTAWSGPHGYHFRIKHAVLREVLRECEKAVLIDTDTFFRCPPGTLFERVHQGQLLCNAIGKRIGQSSKQAQTSGLLNALKARELIDDQMPQTNSGVIGLTHHDKDVLDRSISYIDEFFDIAQGIYTLEELCLAVAAYRRLPLNECTDLIHHYWSRKAQFRAKVTAWYAKHHKALLSEQALSDALTVNDRLPRPAQPLRGLQKLATALIPGEQRQFTRELLYGCCKYPNEFDRACSIVWWEKALSHTEERLGQPLDERRLRIWLSSTPLRLFAGSFHAALSKHLIAIIQCR